jgi:DnaK suppressor protein
MKKTDKQKQHIEKRIEELRARMKKVSDTLDEPADADLEDQAIELEDDEVLEGVGVASQRELMLLEIALQRIANGTYGDCEQCGLEISEARLAAVPFARLCQICASEQSG